MLTGCWQPVNITHDYTTCCFCRVDPPDDEQKACSKHVETYCLNKLIENTTSCWSMSQGWTATLRENINTLLFYYNVGNECIKNV